jgi:hypothetical protein
MQIDHESEHQKAKHPNLQEGVRSELLMKILFYYVLVFSSALPFSKKTHIVG